MSHFIVRKLTGDKGVSLYQYPRSSTDVQYESRTTWGTDRGRARVFTQKGAATRSSAGWGEVVEVRLKLEIELCKECRK